MTCIWQYIGRGQGNTWGMADLIICMTSAYGPGIQTEILELWTFRNVLAKPLVEAYALSRTGLKMLDYGQK